MVMNNNKDFISQLKESRRSTEPPKNSFEYRKRKGSNNTPYTSFLDKYRNLERSIDNLKTRDFVYYFREVAEEEGYKYVIANIKKDMAIFKRLQDNYSSREICGMIEFLFRSEQDYLDKNKLSPNLLASRWVNTIYADMQLWLDDMYKPMSSQKKKTQREWSEKVTEKTEVEIGKWK